MARSWIPWAAVAGLAVVSLGLVGTVREQGRELEALRRDVTRVDPKTAVLEARLSDLERALSARLETAPAASPEPEPEPREVPPTEEVDENGDRIIAIGNVVDPEAHAEQAKVERAVMELLDSEEGVTRDRLRSIIQQEQDAARKARREQRHARRVERMKERVRTMASSAGFSSSETELVVTTLTAEREQIREVYDKAHEDGSWKDARQKRDEIKKKTDEEIAQNLDGEKLDAYNALRERETGGGHGRPAPAKAKKPTPTTSP